jgi:hypothetical protein
MSSDLEPSALAGHEGGQVDVAEGRCVAVAEEYVGLAGVVRADNDIAVSVCVQVSGRVDRPAEVVKLGTAEDTEPQVRIGREHCQAEVREGGTVAVAKYDI